MCVCVCCSCVSCPCSSTFFWHCVSTWLKNISLRRDCWQPVVKSVTTHLCAVHGVLSGGSWKASAWKPVSVFFICLVTVFMPTLSVSIICLFVHSVMKNKWSQSFQTWDILEVTWIWGWKVEGQGHIRAFYINSRSISQKWMIPKCSNLV